MIVNNKRTNKKQDDAGVVHINVKEKINMYDQHPTNVISLHEFHSVALNRLQVLRKIEFM
jgi:hypothetical protein